MTVMENRTVARPPSADPGGRSHPPTTCAPEGEGPNLDDGPERLARTVLVVDDSPTQRLRLTALLRQADYIVLEAVDGASALAILSERPVGLVLSDWMMPGLDGLELCREIRSRSLRSGYVYVVLVTAKSATTDLAQGLSAGADDFLSKPVNRAELIARLAAGSRVVSMQARLADSKARIDAAYETLSRLHVELDRDLAVASLLQRESVPPSFALCNDAPVSVAYRPAGHVGGDLVGYFPVGRRGLCAWAIDVAGHGVAAALMTARLSQLLAPGDPRNLAFADDGTGPRTRDPAAVLEALNARCLGQQTTDLFVAAALAVIDLETGEGRIARSGYPPPMLLRRSGAIDVVEAGGPPLGLFAEARPCSVPFRLDPGERLLLASDGLGETTRPDGTMLGDAGLARLLADHASRSARDLLPSLVERVAAEGGGTGFDDDVSALLVERP